MGIWQRVRGIFRSRNATDEVDVTALDASYREQSALLAQVRRGLADVTTSRRRVELQITQLRSEADGLEARAAEAVAAGDDDAARHALGREVALESLIADLEQQRGVLAEDENRLRTNAERLEAQIAQFRARTDSLKARYSAAQARTQINDAFTGVAAESAGVGEVMRSAEQHTRRLEATADAVDEMVAEGLMTDVTAPKDSAAAAFDRQFEALEKSSEADHRLAALKSTDDRANEEKQADA